MVRCNEPFKLRVLTELGELAFFQNEPGTQQGHYEAKVEHIKSTENHKTESSDLDPAVTFSMVTSERSDKPPISLQVDKAGLEGVDKEKVNKVIYEMSKVCTLVERQIKSYPNLGN